MSMIRAAIDSHYASEREAITEAIRNGYMPTWAEEHRSDPDKFLRRYSTEARWTAYQEGKISREKAVELATARAVREIDKKSAAIAEALNKSPEVLAMVYAAEDLRLQNSPQPSRRDFIGYGLGTWLLPEFEGGVGFSAQAAIFDKLGFTVNTIYSDNTSDIIMIRRK